VLAISKPSHTKAEGIVVVTDETLEVQMKVELPYTKDSFDADAQGKFGPNRPSTTCSSLVIQCELLAVISALMTFSDIFRDSELLVWVDNVPAMSETVHGYSHAPEMASLSNALHLLLADLSATPRFLHVPGKANPADISSRVPFVHQTGSHALDPDRLSPGDARVVDALCACYRPMVLPTAAQLGNAEYFILHGNG
jgi:hypothetical protein